MIRLKQFRMDQAKFVLTLEYSDPGPPVETKTVDVDFESINDRLRVISVALGRSATNKDFLDAVKAIVKEARNKQIEPIVGVNLDSLIGVDLEASG